MTENKIKLGHTPEEQREPSLVPPVIAAIASLIIPGLGQVLGRAVRRGVILFATMITIVFLMAWRFQLAAPRDTGWVNIIKKAFRLDPFLIVVTIAFATHADLKLIKLKLFDIIFGRILHTAIGMMNTTRRWIALVNGHAQSTKRQLCIQIA